MKLSVCIPVYKVEAYIEKCARSLFEQTYDDLEFVFVDDCSPDDSMDVLLRVLADYPERKNQVKILRHEKNAGLVRARKTGLAVATGELIAHCDADDWVDPKFYVKLAEKFADPEVDMAFGPMVRNDDGYIQGAGVKSFEGTAQSFYAQADYILAFNSTVNKVYRREIARREGIVIPDHIKIGEDMCRTLQTVAHCRKVASITDCYYHYRDNEASMSRRFDPVAVLNDLKDVYRTVTAHVPGELLSASRCQQARNIAFYGLKLGVFDATEFRFWWREMLVAGRRHWGDALPLKRRMFLRIASLSYPLARFLMRIIPNTKVDAF